MLGFVNPCPEVPMTKLLNHIHPNFWKISLALAIAILPGGLVVLTGYGIWTKWKSRKGAQP